MPKLAAAVVTKPLVDITLRKLDFTRQSTLINSKMYETDVIIVGVGAIGSHLAEILGKLGIRKVEIYDDDNVESHNLPNQGFRLHDLNLSKVEAVKRNVTNGLDVEVVAYSFRVCDDSVLNQPIVISCVDSMAGRKAVFKAVKNSPKVEAYIEARMGAEYCEVFCIDPQNSELTDWYEKFLYDDSEVAPVRCTEKATIYCAAGCAAIIAAKIKNIVNGEGVARLSKYDFANQVSLPE